VAAAREPQQRPRPPRAPPPAGKRPRRPGAPRTLAAGDQQRGDRRLQAGGQGSQGQARAAGTSGKPDRPRDRRQQARPRSPPTRPRRRPPCGSWPRAQGWAARTAPAWRSRRRPPARRRRPACPAAGRAPRCPGRTPGRSRPPGHPHASARRRPGARPAPPLGALALRPPGDQRRVSPAARMTGQRGKEPVDADLVGKPRRVRDAQRPLRAIAQLRRGDALLGRQHRGAGRAEDVVPRAPVRPGGL
jgi:hypothetical protein